MTWIPHPGPQEEYFKRGEFEVLLGGAAGPGKTDCLLWDATRYVDVPGYRGIIFRRTFPQLQEIIDRCFEYYPQLGAYYRATEHRWYWPSGATIRLGHMQHPNDRYNHQGHQYHYAAFDELTQFLLQQYLYIFSRVRTTNPNIPPRVRSTTNPGGIGHMWVKERFVDSMAPGQTYIDEETRLSRVFIPAKVTDNPTLVDNDPAYIARLKMLPDIERRRLLDGDWEVFSGQVFPNLTRRSHGIEPFEIPPEWERWMVLDWGYAKPFAVGWYAIDYDENIYRYREWYGCKEGEIDEGVKMTAEAVAEGILALEQGEKIKFRYADPSIFNKSPAFRAKESRGPTIGEDFTSAGVFFQKADNDRLQGLQQMYKRFQLQPEIDPETGAVVSEYPIFYCFNDHTHFWRTVPAMYRDEKNVEDVDTKQEDHIYDEVRYSFMTRPIVPKKIEQIPYGSFQHERKRYLKAKRMAASRGISIEQAYNSR